MSFKIATVMLSFIGSFLYTELIWGVFPTVLQISYGKFDGDMKISKWKFPQV